MNGNDDQSIALLSSIIYLKDELQRREVSVDLVEQSFEVQQQILQYTHNVNEQIRVSKATCDDLHKAVYENSIAAGFSEEIASNSEMAIVYMQSSIVELKKAIRTVTHRTAIYCAIAAVVGAIVAWSVPVLIDLF